MIKIHIWPLLDADHDCVIAHKLDQVFTKTNSPAAHKPVIGGGGNKNA